MGRQRTPKRTSVSKAQSGRVQTRGLSAQVPMAQGSPTRSTVQRTSVRDGSSRSTATPVGAKRTLALVVVVSIALFLAVVLGLMGTSAVWHDEDKSSLTLDGTKLTWAKGRPAYTESGYVTRIGIDVSENQGDINWQKVAQDGISFAFIRVGSRGVTEGGLYPDSCFAFNYAEAKKAGLTVGSYVYSQAKTEAEAREEAAMAVQILKSRNFSGQVAFDYEITMGGRIGKVTPATATACAKAFCEAIEEAGYQPVIYGNLEDLGYIDQGLKDRYPLWLALYDQQNPKVSGSYSCWQYTQHGQVQGIDVNVDMNIMVEKEKTEK